MCLQQNLIALVKVTSRKYSFPLLLGSRYDPGRGMGSGSQFASFITQSPKPNCTTYYYLPVKIYMYHIITNETLIKGLKQAGG